MGAVFGTVYTAPVIGQLIAYAAATPLINVLGPRITFIVAGSGVLATLTYVAVRLKATAN